MRRKWVAAPAAAGVMALVVGAPARAEINASAEAGIGYTDNIRRVAEHETSETIGTMGVDLLWQERTRRIRGDATVDLSYFEYMDNTFDSELVGTANGSLALGIVPETLNWVVQDSFGQAQSDPFAASTPETREDLNFFSTGPDLTVRLGSTGFGRVFGRWSSTNYETSPLDAERTTGGVAVGRRASPRTELSLNAVTESIDFDEELNTDYDRDSVFVRWQLDASRTTIDANLGYTWLQRDGSDKQGSALIAINVARQLTASSTLRMTLSQQLGDAGDSLRAQLSGTGLAGGAGQITATADPFESQLVSLEWSYMRGRTGFVLGASHTEDDYESATLFDRKRDEFTAGVSRRVASTITLDLRATLEKEKFPNMHQQNDELRLGATLNWRAWRTLGMRFLLERYDRDTTGGSSDFVENRAFLTLAYYWGDQDLGALGGGFR
nr:outer membrane beta-barrel protein [uncultured Steroidobacter sp.]